MLGGVKLILPSKPYIKEPQDSKYGRVLLENSVELMAEIGFEAFTFKKLAVKMDSSETSIYRYFENKHLLLVYLSSWYWEWLSYLISVYTLNIPDPEVKIRKMIYTLIHAETKYELASYINEKNLAEIVRKESSKSYHIHDIDKENSEGFFLSYKNLVDKMSNFAMEICGTFSYPHSLSCNLLEMINNQRYYAEHLPRLSNLKYKKKSFLQDLEEMVYFFALSALKNKI
jgi:AcrR family transcriptional regulator